MAKSQHTKLLSLVEAAINTHPLDSEAAAQAAIDATADWFEGVLDNIGVQPSAVPALLRWQAHQHEYLND